MGNNRLLRFGVIGTVITALCCFTPILVLLGAAVGLSWAVGYLDYVLFPALFSFIGLTIYALWRRQRSTSSVA
ncbi:MAG: mercury resistance system transport protein MerF [Caldilineaceae bacterium]|nr:mercury resistance system transport protein MerF [Caldilineaceae bacterium]MCB0084437.1 mercury resistance system transport protein MerF [Caldilineaceae bacterium]